MNLLDCLTALSTFRMTPGETATLPRQEDAVASDEGRPRRPSPAPRRVDTPTGDRSGRPHDTHPQGPTAHQADGARSRPDDSPPDGAGTRRHRSTSATDGAPAPRRGARQRLPFILPVRIGTGAHALAGIYQPAAGETPPSAGMPADRPPHRDGAAGQDAPDTAVLICNPFGQEAIRAQRSLRVLAERLGRKGIPSLRFDYFATGDSPGEDGAGHLTRWRQDIHLADVYLRRISGCRQTIWIGLRLGATLALQAALQHDDLPRPQRILLWDPVLDGDAYLEHLRRMNEFWTRQSNVTGEALGFLLTHRIRRHISAIRPDALPSGTDIPLHLIGTQELPGRWDFLSHCHSQQIPVYDALLESAIEWTSNTALDSQWVPDEALGTLLDICAGKSRAIPESPSAGRQT